MKTQNRSLPNRFLQSVLEGTRDGDQICERFSARLVIQHNIDYVPPIYMANAWMYSETHMTPEEEREGSPGGKTTEKEVLAQLLSFSTIRGKISLGTWMTRYCI
ncbi:MAG: hypothetical protein U0V70_01870 [Terriglobia bacterium]